jgi:phosphatidate phosphatase APP1
MRALSRSLLRLCLVAGAALALATSSAAQSGLATVTGIVTDNTGGSVPGLTVTATNQATNIAYTGVTNDSGNYIITSVPIGSYVISVDLQGFKSVQSKADLAAS